MEAVFRAVAAWTDKGRLSVMPQKQYYVSGEKVVGVIQAQINQPIPARAIVLHVVGHEKVEWSMQESRQVLEREATTDRPAEYRTENFVKRFRGKHQFFNQRLELYRINGALQPGNYTFPFEYQLPDGIPGSFYERREKHFFVDKFEDEDEHGNDFYDSDDEFAFPGRGYVRPEYSALIMYKLKVTIDVNGFFSRDLHCKVPLVIHEKLNADVQPAFGKTEGTVCLCCCVPRGKVFLEAHFDKNAYVPGETAQIVANIKNESTSNLKMAVKLMRFLTLKTNGWGGRQSTWTDTVCQQHYDPVAPKTDSPQRVMPLQLQGQHVVPSTNGNLISCTFRYDVECQIDWAPDIELHMPVTIYAPQPPPQWAPQPLF